MKDVLKVYQRPRDEDYPLIFLEEASKQHAKGVREAIRDSKGRLLEDSEYIRNGTSNIFMIVAPLEGWRKLSVTGQRKKVDWAHEISAFQRQCLDQRIPDQSTLINEASAWVKKRNRDSVTVNWQFTLEDARVKLMHLYPKF